MELATSAALTLLLRVFVDEVVSAGFALGPRRLVEKIFESLNGPHLVSCRREMLRLALLRLLVSYVEFGKVCVFRTARVPSRHHQLLRA